MPEPCTRRPPPVGVTCGTLLRSCVPVVTPPSSLRRRWCDCASVAGETSKSAPTRSKVLTRRPAPRIDGLRFAEHVIAANRGER